jgi:hypothetical protein
MCAPRASASTSSGCAYSRSIRSRTRRNHTRSRRCCAAAGLLVTAKSCHVARRRLGGAPRPLCRAVRSVRLSWHRRDRQRSVSPSSIWVEVGVVHAQAPASTTIGLQGDQDGRSTSEPRLPQARDQLPGGARQCAPDCRAEPHCCFSLSDRAGHETLGARLGSPPTRASASGTQSRAMRPCESTQLRLVASAPSKAGR